MAGGNSKISRIASSTERVSDVRFEPVKASGDKPIVTREEMNDFERQVNARLQEIQTALNDVALAVKLKQ